MHKNASLKYTFTQEWPHKQYLASWVRKIRAGRGLFIEFVVRYRVQGILRALVHRLYQSYSLFTCVTANTLKKKVFKASVHTIARWEKFRKPFKKKTNNKDCVGFITPEFYHSDCGGFGGYGANLKKIAEHCQNHSRFTANIFLTRVSDKTSNNIMNYHNTPVLFRPNQKKHYILNFLRYAGKARERNIDLLLSIDWYKEYEYTANALPATPLLVWIRDPRSAAEWKAVATVPNEMQVCGDYSINQINKIIENKKTSISKLMAVSKKTGRKIQFAVQARFLTERARQAYGIDIGNPVFLPKPLHIPEINEITYSSKPTIGFLGRLEPVKRPWIFFELAKRFPDVDFLVAGKSHFPEIMNPIIEKYSHIHNLKFLGLLPEEQKDKFLKSIWGLVLPSIHEAMPNVFEEAFSYGKPVVSCQNPDNAVAEFGFYTGEILGQGLDNNSLDAFSKGIEELLSNHRLRKEKGIRARKHVETVNSFTYFEDTISKILAECH